MVEESSDGFHTTQKSVNQFVGLGRDSGASPSSLQELVLSFLGGTLCPLMALGQPTRITSNLTKPLGNFRTAGHPETPAYIRR